MSNENLATFFGPIRRDTHPPEVQPSEPAPIVRKASNESHELPDSSWL